MENMDASDWFALLAVIVSIGSLATSLLINHKNAKRASANRRSNLIRIYGNLRPEVVLLQGQFIKTKHRFKGDAEENLNEALIEIKEKESAINTVIEQLDDENVSEKTLNNIEYQIAHFEASISSLRKVFALIEPE